MMISGVHACSSGYLSSEISTAHAVALGLNEQPPHVQASCQCTPWEAEAMAVVVEVVGSLPPTRQTRWNSGILASACPSPGCCGHLGC